MKIDFNDPLSVMLALHEATETQLGVAVSPEFLAETVKDLLRKKHKDLYEQRIRHRTPSGLMDILDRADKYPGALKEEIQTREAAKTAEKVAVQYLEEIADEQASTGSDEETPALQEQVGDTEGSAEEDSKQRSNKKKRKANR